MLLPWSKDLHPIGFRDAVNIANATHIKVSARQRRDMSIEVGHIVDSENKFTFYEIYVRLIDYEIFIRFTQTRP